MRVPFICCAYGTPKARLPGSQLDIVALATKGAKDSEDPNRAMNKYASCIYRSSVIVIFRKQEPPHNRFKQLNVYAWLEAVWGSDLYTKH